MRASVQQQLVRYGVNPLKIRAVFISHLHGDHVFGLFPLISTLALYGRKTPLRVFAPAPFGEILACHLRYFDTELPYTVAWTEVDTTKHALLLENRTLEVWSVPLRHRVPCAGFLFREKEPPLNVEKFKIAKYGLSIAQITAAKRGEEIRLATGEVIPNAELTYRPYAPRSYAYLSDTNYSAKAAGLCRGVDLMYHEATYAAAEQRSARDRGHSTTTDAAKAAPESGARRLVISHYSSRYRTKRRWSRRRGRSLPKLPGDRRNHLHHRKTTMTKADATTRPRAGRQTRPHGLDFFRRRGGSSSANCALRTSPYAGYSRGKGVQRARVETVAPRDMERLSLLKTPSNSLALVEIPPLRPEARAAAGQLTRRSTTCRTRKPGASSGWPTGSASRTSSARSLRPTVSTPRSYKPRWGRSCGCGFPADLGRFCTTQEPPGCPFTARSGRRISTAQRLPGRGASSCGQRKTRHLAGRGARRDAQALHPALPDRPPRVGVAQRGDGHGHRMLGIPASGRHGKREIGPPHHK